jgi:hypothetical protein
MMEVFFIGLVVVFAHLSLPKRYARNTQNADGRKGTMKMMTLAYVHHQM